MNCWLASCFLSVGVSVSCFAAPINQVPYASLTGTELITFDDVSGGLPPGTVYDDIFESGNTAFGERFAGQTLSAAGNSDVLSGVPTGPLTLVTGSSGQNLNVVLNLGTQVLSGLGPLGFPDFNAIGEGSFALLFDFDQSEFGFQLVGGNSGTATIEFFRRDGSLIDTIVLTGLADTSYGFSRDGGVRDIAGISIYNDDLAGIGFDNLKHDVAGIPDVPEPGTLVLLSLGMGCLLVGRRSLRC